MFISPRILLKKVGLNYFYFYACKIGIAQLLVICLIILNFKYVYTEYLVFFYLFTSICCSFGDFAKVKMFDLAWKDMTEGRSKYFNFKLMRDLNI